MDFVSLLGLLPEILRIAPIVSSAVNTGISFNSIASVVQNPDILNVFTQLGSSLFPKAAPQFHAAAALVASYNPDYTKWLQNSLNALVSPSPNLVVDGHYGPKTRAAVEALQTELGLKIDGWAGDATSAAIQLALSKLGTHA